ncbi:MAG: hypothetical protein IPM82_30290 [Saprospiraceae bacterium]|nr:hypothetical protein [Saprospiraceae bacterium]
MNVPVDYFIQFLLFRSKADKHQLPEVFIKDFKNRAVVSRKKRQRKFVNYLELEHLINPTEKPKPFIYDKVIENADEQKTAAKARKRFGLLAMTPIRDVVEMLETKVKVIELDAPDGFDGMKANADGQK